MAASVKDLVSTAKTAASNHQASIAAAQATATQIAAKRGATARQGTAQAAGQAMGSPGAA